MTRFAVLAALLLGACGGGGDAGAEQPDVLDNAIAAAGEAGTGDPGEPADDDGSMAETTAASAALDELPAPDPSLFVGRNRVVNLWVGADGRSQSIDVWGRRTFSNGPILLAESVAFASATEFFSAPVIYDLVVVGAGAGPDGAELARVTNAHEAQQLTTVFTNDDDGVAIVVALWEIDPTGGSSVAAPPPEGLGVVRLSAPNTTAFVDELRAAVGGATFLVGDGSGVCRSQRAEEQGFEAEVLGGPGEIEIVLEPGPTLISLHPSFSPEPCAQPAVLEFTVDVVADDTTLAMIYTADGELIEVLTLPAGR